MTVPVAATMTKKWKRRHARRYIKLLEAQLNQTKPKVQLSKDPKDWGFYGTDQWMQLRYRVLKSRGRKCEACLATDKPVHVDHIKPRSKYPHLALVESNLQVLCRACNLGKSNKDETDWRSPQ